MKCKKGFEVTPLKSFSGYYMGTFDPEEGPNCRLSTEYAKTVEGAQSLALDRQNADENIFCNGCGNCFN